MNATTTTQSKTGSTSFARPAVPEELNVRLWYYFTLGLLVVTVICMIVYLLSAVEWSRRPFMGVLVTSTLSVTGSLPTTNEAWVGLDAGLKIGDHILAVDGTKLANDPADYAASVANYNDLLNSKNIGDQIVLQFRRNEPVGAIPTDSGLSCIADGPSASICETQPFAVSYFPAGDLLAYLVIPYFSGIAVIIVGCVIFWLRPKQPVAMLATVISLFTAIFIAGMADFGMGHKLLPIWMLATAWLGGGIATLGLIFPIPTNLVYRQPVLRFVPLVLTSLVGTFAVFTFYNPTGPSGSTFGQQLVVFCLIVCAILITAVLFFHQRRRAATLVTRDQANSLFIGMALTMIPVIIWISNRGLQLAGYQPIPLSLEAMTPFFITPILGIAYAILYYRRMDTDQIISRGITYLIMLGSLIIGYFLLVTGFSFIANEFLESIIPAANNPLIVALTVFAMSFLFIPVRSRLQQRIDAIYYKTRRDYQHHVELFSQKMTTVMTYEDIVGEFRSILNQTLYPANTFIFLFNPQLGDYTAFGEETDVRFSRESGIVSLLQKRDSALYLEAGQAWPPELQVDRVRLSILKVMILIGLHAREKDTDALNGFVLISAPRSGANAYNFEELRFINNLSGQLGVAIDRAQVVDSLRLKVRELNILSQVGEAVNYLIEFDDLLELISNQTSRLIDASNFYIAMHDPSTDQLFFAFFLEENERLRDKEDNRWLVDRDLFSEVIKTNQPVRIADFAREMAAREASVPGVNPHLRAWMGVPLIAGTRPLGVMAVARTHSAENYTNEQFKSFSDIGALAASSIDKARLFAETNVRARQLSALNEISQRLVATELDVERMLEIITRSAVDILNAEAGSLLLSTDDNLGDLEFKVVIGGSGSDLIGSRIKAGMGVVGQVAKSGRPLISNDAEHDPRHASQVSAYQTDSLLAVPLIAKERVIGVLEVLNKKDGTIFVDDDIHLLTTFASQAAVALENARMFEMTDIQLSQRVEELEMLERIDTDLNRSLNLREVAEITIRWAVTNSKAQAGALGILEKNPLRLRIVAMHGYLESEFPDGSEEMDWPVDRGIIKRVLRTHQSDFAPDVSIDPDYEPGLTGSLSQITVPMFSGDDINAILILETNSEPRFTLGNWAFANRLAEHASIAIANAQLVEVLDQANVSKSEFMGFAAHELKNPLTSIKGYAASLLGGALGQLNDPQTNFLRVIHSNADRMQTIIEDLRISAMIDAKQKLVDQVSPISMRNVIVETLRPFQQQLDQKSQKVRNDIPEDLPLILGDQNRLIQVLTNLISNAHKYSPPETEISILASVKENYQDRRGQRKGRMLQVTVADQGIGMDEEDLSKIFREKYFRSENQLAQDQPGTGLGMMITQEIVQQHGGDIWVESKIGEGSRFNFVIPIAPEDQQNGAAHPEEKVRSN